MRLTPEYDTMLFTDVWDDADDFKSDYNASPLKSIEDTNAVTLFWLLYARHGNDPIASMDVFQWKQRLFSIIFQYGPNWVKELEIQETLRGLTDAQIQAGALQISNHAYNPETAPSTTSGDVLTYINEQNTQQYKKGIVDAYMQLDALLKRDVTNAFLNRFDNLFKHFVYPEQNSIYVTEDD